MFNLGWMHVARDVSAAGSEYRLKGKSIKHGDPCQALTRMVILMVYLVPHKW